MNVYQETDRFCLLPLDWGFSTCKAVLCLSKAIFFAVFIKLALQVGYMDHCDCLQKDVPVLNPLTPELNPSAQRCLTGFFIGDFASSTMHFLNICVKNKYTNYSFSLLIMYGISYMFRHYIAIHRERS
jgi:hypothetical protein